VRWFVLKGTTMHLDRPTHPFITYLTYPALALLTAAGIALTLTQNLNRNAMAGLLAVVPVLVAVVVEGRYPLAEKWRMTKQSLFGRDLPWIVATVISERFAETAAVLVAATFVSTRGFGPLAALPIGVQVVLTLIAFDLVWYGYHRYAHTSARLWRVHGTHHAPSQLYALVHLVLHPFDGIVSRFVIALVVFRFSGASPDAIFIAVVVLSLQQLISHVNADLRVGPLNYVLIGAETHRYHHSADDLGNYGSVTPIWDILFRTFIYQPHQVPNRIGLDNPATFPNPEQFHQTLTWPIHHQTIQPTATS
jgi:sterol desaturase/sphingolipid hydroxylase (fatty acid hydroxylase superfamily)